MSLPLPRPVGVESDDELLTLRAYKDTGAQEHRSIGSQEDKSKEETCNYSTNIHDNLSEQLPEGFELISVNFVETRTPYQPRSVKYVFSVRPEFLDEKLKNRINNLIASESLYVRRPINKLRSNFKDMDVRCFINSMELKGGDIAIECGVSSTGSIRVQEVLGLLELDEAMLASPIRRTNIQWRDV
jgi:hypothetical protein